MASEGSIRIPPEIINNILYRLPAKSLGRFKSVSKDWLSLISEPQFIKTHHNTHKRCHLIVSNHHRLCSLQFPRHEAEPVPEPTNIRFELHYLNLTIHGSCNGLVLVSGHDFASVHIVVLNPTTGEFVECQHPIMRTLVDFLEIEIMYGFGYDSVTDDYKVVTISYFHNSYLIPPDNMSIHVYSLRTNTWKEVTDSPYDHSHWRSLPGVFVDGFLHWVANKDSDHSPVIIAFSLADEKFYELPSPNLHNNAVVMSRIACNLIVLGGKLAIFVKDEVWLMNEYGVRESWTKILVNGLDGIPIVEPMSLYVSGKFLLVSHDFLLVYDVEETTFCKIVNVSRKIKGLRIRGTYVESLVSPKFS
ncbi:hypothetical protein L2E82_41915 [Cichorium intybus]|uniref:Uncharacterized protein n=1 Tax=Cichorium intybus TaxID=13427 RepID=A0ACB8ZKB8_CICIN|nr:hypothetical protein L2E82_41915 [Cichorium intybus]